MIQATEQGFVEVYSGKYKEMQEIERLYQEETQSTDRSIEEYESEQKPDSWNLFDVENGTNGRRHSYNSEESWNRTSATRNDESLRTGNIEISTKADSVESAFSNAETDTDSNKNYIPADKFGQAIQDFTE